MIKLLKKVDLFTDYICEVTNIDYFNGQLYITSEQYKNMDIDFFGVNPTKIVIDNQFVFESYLEKDLPRNYYRNEEEYMKSFSDSVEKSNQISFKDYNDAIVKEVNERVEKRIYKFSLSLTSNNGSELILTYDPLNNEVTLVYRTDLFYIRKTYPKNTEISLNDEQQLINRENVEVLFEFIAIQFQYKNFSFSKLKLNGYEQPY